jgi:hypothetical protein
MPLLDYAVVGELLAVGAFRFAEHGGGEIAVWGTKNLRQSRKTTLRIIVLVTARDSAPPRAVVAPVAVDPHRLHPELWVPNLGINMAEIAPGRLGTSSTTGVVRARFECAESEITRGLK